MIKDEVPYWVWLVNALGFGSYKIKAVKKLYDIKDFYNAQENEWTNSGIFSKTQIEKLLNSNLDEALKITEKAERLNQKIITFCDKEYPKNLENIFNPPAVLYAKGDVALLNKNILIGMVGTREATEYGLLVTENLSFDLARGDVVIVSGGALGIDSKAHRSSLNASGKTIAVLGCGLDYNYPVKNKSLREDIEKEGLLISEYPPSYPPTPKNFPLRNRIISGLSNGIVVVEAGEKSGSLITANIALEQNRDVFAIPGNINNKTSRGTNLLIKHGAKPVLDSEDILEDYGILKTPFVKVSQKISSEGLNILNLMSNNVMELDEICFKSNLPINKVISSITELEISNLIISLSGKRYCKNNRVVYLCPNS